MQILEHAVLDNTFVLTLTDKEHQLFKKWADKHEKTVPDFLEQGMIWVISRVKDLLNTC